METLTSGFVSTWTSSMHFDQTQQLSHSLRIPLRELLYILLFDDKTDICVCLYSLTFKIVETARQHPDLIIFLDIFEMVKEFRNEFQGARKTTTRLLTAEIDVQTDVHPISGAHFDPNYVWNVWDYRRKAIQLSMLLKAQTTSAQTDLSYQTMGVETQTWSPREIGLQTRKDTAINVPRPMRYVRRIRGDGMNESTCEDKNGKTENLTSYVEDDWRC